MKQILQTEAFRHWELTLKDKRLRTIIAARLFRLANGLPGDVKPVSSGISELRIHYGAGYRIYFRQQGEIIIILLCGGDKSSQDKDIFLAKTLAKASESQEIFRYE